MSNVTSKSVKQQRPTSVSSKKVLQKCHVTVFYKSVKKENQARISQSVLQHCEVRMSYKSGNKACQVRMSYKSVT